MTRASDNPYPSILVEEHTDPAAPGSGYKRLFVDSADHKLKSIDSSSAIVEFGAGLADQGAFTYLDATEAAAPSTPASGKVRIYAKSDGRIYSKDDTGAEYGPFDEAGAGSTALQYVDTQSLHASGDEFSDPYLSGWTLSGTPTGSAVTTEVYDDTALDITFGAQSYYMYKAVPAGTAYTIYLTVYGYNNNEATPTTATQCMLGVGFWDNSGNGTGMSHYNDSKIYMWGIASHAYSASGNIICTSPSHVVAASDWPVVYKLQRFGSTITGGFSMNGGVSYLTNTRTDSTSFTRMGIIRLYTGGGTNPRIRVGRFNVTVP